MLWIQLYNKIIRKFSNFSKKKPTNPPKIYRSYLSDFLNYKCSYTEVNVWGLSQNSLIVHMSSVLNETNKGKKMCV